MSPELLSLVVQLISASQARFIDLLQQAKKDFPALHFVPAAAAAQDASVIRDGENWQVDIASPGDVSVTTEGRTADEVSAAAKIVEALERRRASLATVIGAAVRGLGPAGSIAIAELEEHTKMRRSTLQALLLDKRVVLQGVTIDSAASLVAWESEAEISRYERRIDRPATVTRELLIEIGNELGHAGRIEYLMPDSDDRSLREAEAGAEICFFGWRANDAAKAFGEHHALERRLPLASRCGEWGELATAFARNGLWIREARSSVEAFVEPLEAATRSSDLLAIVAAFGALRRERFVAESCFGQTMSSGFAELTLRARATRRTGVVFWHSQDHEHAFDENGMLADSLALRWDGDRDLICSILTCELAGARLCVRTTPLEREVIWIERAPLH